MKSVPEAGHMMVTPHHLATQAGQEILAEGGSAIEATVAAAATIAVAYPHMNGIGGDGFWLIHLPDGTLHGIDASGYAGANVSIEAYRRQGHEEIPPRGPMAANTVAGTISGWAHALSLAGGNETTMPLGRVLESAIYHAEHGVPVSASHSRLCRKELGALKEVAGFADQFLQRGKAPLAGDVLDQAALAETFRCLASKGLDTFYRGELSRRIAVELKSAGSLLDHEDLTGYHARHVQPLSLSVRNGQLYNLPPPSQGFASLMLLGIFERLNVTHAEGFHHVHGIVEATKQAFLIRDRILGDPGVMQSQVSDWLTNSALDRCTGHVNQERAAPWQPGSSEGDTVWLGAADSKGCVVSFIQSLFWEFGSGVVLPETGILWQNRGSSFSLLSGKVRSLAPGRQPFHTLNPAMALLDDGRVMAYGTMGGDGQPQTQAAVYSRYVHFGQKLQQSISAPRWLLGRTWGQESTSLKLESRIEPELADQLLNAGHDIEWVDSFDDIMGHAGAVVRHSNGMAEGAADPRSDGQTFVN